MTPTPIIYIHSSDELYGSDVVLLNLVRRLDPHIFHPIVLTPTDIPYEGLLSRELQAASIEHHALDLPVLRRRYLSPTALPGLLRRVLAAPGRVRPFLTNSAPPLLHSNTTAVMAGALTRRRPHVPHLWHVHEIITQPVWLRKWIAFMVARSSDHVVAISQAVASHLLSDQPGLVSRLSVIYDAVDTETYRPDNDGQALRKSWETASDQVLVGVIGRISAWKGQELFLRALAQALKQAPNLRGVIVGGPVPGEIWRLDALKSLAQELGIASHLTWAGFRTDMPQVMAALDIVIVPSTRPEPFGMVVIEAMASARPVIATRHGGPIETVQEGITGYLVSPHNPTEMSAALVRLATRPDLRRQLGAAGRQRVLQYFSYAPHIAAFQELYQEMLAAAP